MSHDFFSPAPAQQECLVLQPGPGVMATQIENKPNHAISNLQVGDHLPRNEFERRYEAMAEVKKAELIDGVVYVPSPVCNDGHAVPHVKLIGRLVAYEAHTPGVQAADNSTVRLDWDNEPQRDFPRPLARQRSPAVRGHETSVRRIAKRIAVTRTREICKTFFLVVQLRKNSTCCRVALRLSNSLDSSVPIYLGI